MEIHEYKVKANTEQADHLGIFFSPSTNLHGSETNDFYYNRAHQVWSTHSLRRPNLEGVHTPRESLVNSSNTPVRITGQADI